MVGSGNYIHMYDMGSWRTLSAPLYESIDRILRPLAEERNRAVILIPDPSGQIQAPGGTDG